MEQHAKNPRKANAVTDVTGSFVVGVTRARVNGSTKRPVTSVTDTKKADDALGPSDHDNGRVAIR